LSNGLLQRGVKRRSKFERYMTRRRSSLLYRAHHVP